ncbi:MAG: iron-sulfur cluster-binding domain-containing protein [Acidobacteria bacterium]|nr:iron-sulfur cluster-binding domain-containing protein [Acidobacteriota bacterium]
MFLVPVEASWLSAATTVHLALAALCSHRQPARRWTSPLALVSVLLAGAPWAFPTLGGVLGGLAVHAAWFALCVRLTPTATASSPVAAASAPRVATPPARRAADAKPKGFVQAPILAVLQESTDIKTFRLARPEGFDFTPGQFLTLRVRADGKDVVRCYSISSPPAARGYLEISVRRQGLVSNALHAMARPGSMLSVRAPAGAFVYPGGDDRPIVLLAGGIGITPLISMVRHALMTEPTRPVTLLYSARELGEFAFRDELLTLTRRHEDLRLVFAVTRGEAPPDVHRGRIDATLLAATVPDLQHAISMICGPQAMIDDLTATLHQLSVPPDQVRSERFEAAVAASAGRPSTAAEPVAAVSGGAFQMQERRSARTVPVTRGQTLLDAADAHGLEIPSLCRAGVCGTCRTRVIEGDVRCDGGVLDDADRESGYVLACVASPRSHCVIEVA